MKNVLYVAAIAALLFAICGCKKSFVEPKVAPDVPAELSITKDPGDTDRIYNFPLSRPVTKDVDLGSWILDPKGTTITLAELPSTLTTSNNYYGYYYAAALVSDMYLYIDGKLAAAEAVSISVDSTGRNVVKFDNLHYTFNKLTKVNFRGNISSNSSGNYNPLSAYTATAVVNITGDNIPGIIIYDSTGKRVKNSGTTQHITAVTEGSVNTFNFY